MQSRLTRALRYPVLASALALACCAPPPPPEPAAPPVQRPAPTPVPPPPVQEPVYENFLDAPQTPGDWKYSRDPGETFAIFSSGSDPVFWIACRLSSREMGFVIPTRASGSRVMRVRTETTDRLLTTQPLEGRGLLTTISATDPLLDAMALSRGRFAVEVEGQRTLYLPAWAEVTRVIQDCR